MLRRPPSRAQGRTRTRQARLRAVVETLRRRYGPHIVRLGADLATLPAGAGWTPLSTGSLGLDLLVGGLPHGAVTEYAGVEGAGTETLAMAALAACQRAGGLALLVDVAGTADGEALAQIGVDPSALPLVCPTTALEAWDALLALSRCGALDVLAVTSLPGLLALPEAGWGRYRLDRLLGRLALAVRGRSTALLLTNLPLPSFGDAAACAWPTTGGHAIAQAATLRIAVRSTGVRVTEDGDVAALGALATVVKYHGLDLGAAVPLEITPRGPRRAAELVALGRATGCLQETALGLVMADRVLGRTPARAATLLEADPALAAELERCIITSWAATRTAAGAGAAGAARR